jgi:hypothetical protein
MCRPSLFPIDTRSLSDTGRRRELLKLPKAVSPSAVVTITRMDRLARSTLELFAILVQIEDAGGQRRLLGEPVGQHRHLRAIDGVVRRSIGPPLVMFALGAFFARL